MSTVLVPIEIDSDLLLLKVAREIAFDHKDLETILKVYQIPPEKWETIKSNPRFTQLLESEITAWQSANNTAERTKLKAAALIEQWLPEANTRLHDSEEALPAKNDLAKTLAGIAGLSRTGVGVEGGGGEKFSVTINLGADANLKFEKELPPKVIDAAPNE